MRASECVVVGPLRVPERDRPAVAARVAALSRASHVYVDPLPGLPISDGAVERADTVEQELRAGTMVCLARHTSGVDVGVLRVVAHSPQEWELRRLSIQPEWAGQGLGRRLMDRAEEVAAHRNVRSLFFDAVVERGKPQIWARRGYRVVSRWPSEERPLTEVTMARDAAAPRDPLAYPWEGDDALPASGALVTWWLAGEVLLATAGPIRQGVLRDVRGHAEQRGVAAGRFAGADVWPEASHADLETLRAVLGGDDALRQGDALVFRRSLAEVPAYLMPRSVEPGLRALWRFPSGIAVP
ncbi:MAG: GNAT family N-acetyltransferase [Egibacteraceae bacterium]